MKITPNFRFKGNCREAIAFYKECFGGSELNLNTFGSIESFAKTLPSELHDKIMHTEFKSGDLRFYACDNLNNTNEGCCGGSSTTSGDRMIDLSLEVASESEQTEVFNKLARGGVIEMPLQDTFWGAWFGIVIDKFGIKWMLNFEKNQK